MSKTSPGALHGKTLLVLEDEPIISMDLKLEAAELGARVVRHATAQRALLMLDEDTVDAAVLDYTLPARGSADPVAKVLQARGVPFVFYSGDLAQHGDIMRLHGAPVIEKPAPVREVLAALTALMG